MPQQELRRSNQITQGNLPVRLQNYHVNGSDTAHKASQEESDPLTIKETLESRHALEWQKAMRDELEAIEANETWELVKLPHGRRAIGSKWVFKTKVDTENKTQRRKARLVAKGFSRKYGIDYNDVFAPVVRGATLRMLLSIAGKRNYIVKQYDVKTAFLNGTLEEEIYMKPPPGLPDEGKVYRLKKSL